MVIRSSVLALLAGAIGFMSLSGGPARGQGTPLAPERPATTNGPLRVSSPNPRYFEDPDGKVVFLTGSHTWANFQDAGFSDPPPAFDFDAYLDFLATHNHNFFRLWMSEAPRWAPEAAQAGFFDHFDPVPWARTGPGMANDGKPRFDLTQFDQSYFDRMRTRIIAAGQRGIYVPVMLFNGWSIEDKDSGMGNPFTFHPMHSANNVNGIDGDPNADGQGREIHTLTVPAVTALQEAYVRKVIDTVGDLDNVLYEISNESDAGSDAWQNHMVSFIRIEEASRPKQHPIGRSVEWPNGSNQDLINSGADWISPNGNLGDPPWSDGTKVLFTDTDHLCGVCGERAWVWRSFLRGTHPILMDPYDGAATGVGPNTAGSLESPFWNDIRDNMGYTLTYAGKLDLAHAVPRPDLVSQGECLSSAGAAAHPQFLIYLPNGGAVDVDLSEAQGALDVEWLDPKQGLVYAAPEVEGGAITSFDPPFIGDALLMVSLAPGPGGGDPSCADGIDNDGDGLTDYPDDPDCSSAIDALEAPDEDSDGVPDDGAPGFAPCATAQSQNCDDNCRYWPNPGQEDRGGIGALASMPDGIGDACQCGDVSGDGRVTTADSIIIQRSLLLPPTAAMSQPHLCDVGGSVGCSNADAAIVKRAQGTPPSATIQQQCGPALMP